MLRAIIPCLVILTGCLSCRETARDKPAVIVLHSSAELDRSLGKRVRVEGRAVNTKGVALMVDGSFGVEIGDFSQWTAEIEGAIVIVEGTLSLRPSMPATDPHLAIQMEGPSSGPVYVLSSIVYRRK